MSIPSAVCEPAAGSRWAERLPHHQRPVPGAAVRVDLADLARASQGAFAPLAQARRIACVLDVANGPHAVTGDRRLLLRLTVDLLGNAFRVTPDGGHLVIAVWRCAGDELLQVRASGAGLPSDPPTRGFDPVVGLPGSGGRAPELAMLRQVAAAHGGWAGAHSAGIGQDITFTVGLPALRAEA